MLVYLDGEYLPAERARISIWDGGFLYGDGVYTSLRLYSGRPLDLPAHLERLRRHAAALELPVPLSDARFAAVVARLAARNGLTAADARLRITVSRGGDADDPLPLRDLERLRPTVLVTLAPVPPAFAAWARDGIAACLLAPGSARGNLPHLKTLNALPALLAQRQAAARGCREAILVSEDGHLLEGSVSNLFLARDGRLCTPAGDDGLLAGRTRERVLTLAAGLGLACEARRLSPADLLAADEAFTASSVREILPVVGVDERPVGEGRPGPLTRRIQTAYRELVARELAGGGPAR
ncbi:D-amino acid aminotransferase [bacterium]|nr:D-amino acid aminotransferase [bacterium]